MVTRSALECKTSSKGADTYVCIEEVVASRFCLYVRVGVLFIIALYCDCRYYLGYVSLTKPHDLPLLVVTHKRM
jgi:hypothetical protein